jgi:hypothetical protein
MTDEAKLEMSVSEQPVTLDITPHTHNQIGQRLGIPAAYYKRMLKDSPSLLSQNVNHWFINQSERRMVRTLDGKARAYGRDRYRVVDHYEILETVLPVIGEMGEGMNIVSTEVTETKLYLKVINKRLELEVNKGDVVQAGFVISNSEIGLGAVSLEPLIYRMVCSNGMIAKDYSQKRYHIGRAASADESFELYASETIKADERAFLLKIRDTVRSAVDLAKFSQVVEQMRHCQERKIEGNPVTAINVTAKHFGLNQGESSSVLTHLIQGGDLTAYGLLNAMTRTAQDLESYDRATELEGVASQVLTLPSSTWKEIAFAQ